MKAYRKIELAMQLVMVGFAERQRIGKISVPAATHSMRVGSSLLAYGYSIEEALAGYCHDFKEDTDLSLKLIGRHFGPRVAYIVDNCSVRDDLQGVEAEDELYMRVERIAEEGDIGPLVVKGADSLDNLRTNRDLKPEWQIGAFRRGCRWLNALRTHRPNDDLTDDLDHMLTRENRRLRAAGLLPL